MKFFHIRNVLLVVVMVGSVHCGCVERDRRDTISEKTSNNGFGITDFLSNLRCNIQSGAQQFKETVANSLNYVKKTFSTDKEHNRNNENIAQNDDEKDGQNDGQNNAQNSSNNDNGNRTVSILNNDRIIFMNDNEEIRKSVPIVNISEVLTRPVTIGVANTTNVNVGDRNAIAAPIVCPKGQRLVDQKCVPIVEF